MSELLNAPIAGQSLTDTPKNYPWERPAEISDPREAIKFHMDGLSSPESLDNILELIQMGVPLRALAKTALTTAQMEGIHSVDVSLIIGDVVFEELVSIAEEAGLDYKTGDEPSEFEAKEKEDELVLAMLRKKLDALDPESEDTGEEFMRQVETMMAEPQEEEQQDTEEMPMMESPVEEAPRGLMARG
jgi:protein-tyrosine-phosphatase